MCKYIVVAGGVISGVGKGVTTASTAKILKEYGFKVTVIKIDPYINYDAGTLRPTEHGEVWVTDDGGEIDQDLGNYERFLDVCIPKKNNITTGQIYKTVIDDERAGKYLGKTVQFIPHIPEEIIKRVKDCARGYDFCLIEIGGTIGDFENIPFLFAMKSLEREVGKKNVVYVLITYLPIPSHIEEMKTKPTQQAIRMLTEHGIFPDFIICRSKKPADKVRKNKIETYANIKSDYVISEPDIDTIYRIPLDLEKENFGLKILKEVGLTPKQKPDWKKWSKLVNNIVGDSREVKIAIVGKYVDIGDFDLADSYISINQALQHAGANLNVKPEIDWIDSKRFEIEPKRLPSLKEYAGIIIPGGFGSSGIEGKIKAISFARKNNIPFLGLCYGMQLAVVEYARNVCGMADANTTEVDKTTTHPVIDILPSQKELIANSKYGGTMRLGAYAAMLKDNTMVSCLYEGRIGSDMQFISKFKNNENFRLGILNTKKVIFERHRHRFEVNPDYIQALEAKGLIFSGYHIRNDQTRLMEFIELPSNKFFIATQAHPEFKSSLLKPAPLFSGFIRSML
ncbi:MAG: CTP synthase [Nanoarchaeota archaeon]